MEQPADIDLEELNRALNYDTMPPHDNRIPPIIKRAARAYLQSRALTSSEPGSVCLDDLIDELAFGCEKIVFEAMTRRAAPPGFMKLATDAVRAYFTSSTKLRASLTNTAKLEAENKRLREALVEARGWIDLAEDYGRDNSRALKMVDAALGKTQ